MSLLFKWMYFFVILTFSFMVWHYDLLEEEYQEFFSFKAWENYIQLEINQEAKINLRALFFDLKYILFPFLAAFPEEAAPFTRLSVCLRSFPGRFEWRFAARL